MRIQHNIMAMNAYRNYNTNTSALSKNLEKLSSGYKINRAGDDAAGLAISEKMRAQITGLNAAQKNVKDGISLVKTAEGAMQEIQDMLNRMKYIATQSANGTYQDKVDRENLQKELESLRTEIDRIADSANFNGIQLLDGRMTEDGRVEQGKSIKNSEVSNMMARDGVSRGGTANSTFTVSATNVGSGKAVTKASFATPMVSASGDVKVKFEEVEAASAVTAATATAAASAALGSMTFTFGTAGSAGNGYKIKFVTSETATASISAAYASASKTITVTLKHPGSGNTAKTYTASAVADKINAAVADVEGLDNFAATGNSSKNITVSSTASATLGTVTLAGGKDEKAKQEAGWNVTVTCGSNTSVANVKASAFTGASLSVTGFEGAFAGLKLTVDTDKAKAATGSIVIGTLVKASGSGSKDTSIAIGKELALNFKEMASDAIKASDTIQIGTTYFKFVDKTGRALNGTGTQGDPYQVEVTGTFTKDQALKALASAITEKKDDLGVSATYDDKTGKLTLKTTKKFDSADDLKSAVTVVSTNKDVEDAWGSALEEAIEKLEKDDDPEVGGKLRLQIGDDEKGYNTMYVSIGQMNTWTMGQAFTYELQTDGTIKYNKEDGDTIASIDIKTASAANAALEVIKNAINYVSSVRGDLGAIQNRLDHTLNNLSVMTENIQDAESTIRDTDVAEEMMAYTKNNILIQSAQAMLAQANAVPQGVLQLLG